MPTPVMNQHCCCEGEGGTILGRVSVLGLVVTGGFLPFDKTIYDYVGGTGHVYEKMTVVTVTTDWYGDHYETHTETLVYWISDTLGDVYHFQAAYDNGYWIDQIADDTSTSGATIVNTGGTPTAIEIIGGPGTHGGGSVTETVRNAWIQGNADLPYPLVRSETTATLGGSLRSWPGLGAAKAIMDQVDIECNATVTVEGGAHYHTGISRDNGDGHFDRQYARGAGGLIARTFAGSGGSFAGAVAGSWFGLDSSLITTQEPILRIAWVNNAVVGAWKPEYTALWNRAAKCKVVMGKPTYMATKVELDPHDCTAAIVAIHKVFGLSNTWGSAACEPCYTATGDNRCLYAKEWRPEDTYIPGVILIENTPVSMVAGNLDYDIDGDGDWDTVDSTWLYYNTRGCPLVVRGMEGAPIEIRPGGSRWPLAVPLAEYYYGTCDCTGNFWIQLPFNYEGNVSVRVMVETVEYWFAFYTWGMTVEPFGTSWTVFSRGNPTASVYVSPLAAGVQEFLFQPLPPLL